MQNDQKQLPLLAEAARTLSFTDEELEFLRAMDAYKRQHRRPSSSH